VKKLRAFLAGLLFYVPFGASAIPPLVVALIVAAVAVAGFSIYRSFVPVDLSDGLAFFSSCWSCDLFSGILKNLSDFIPKIYGAIGTNIIPIAAGLTFVWFAWKIIDDYIHVSGNPDAWQITGMFGMQVIKLAFVAAILAFPLPKFMMDTFVAPVMNVGLSYNHVARDYIQPEDQSFEKCLIATALNDPSDADAQAYSPKLRHNVSCQIAEFHQITGLGMTLGWAFANMAFDADYMFLHFLPNVLLLIAGLTIMMMFFWALMPVPLYFLEVFVKLSLDLVMLPLMLLGWLFSGWTIFPSGKQNIMEIINDAVKNTCGIALVGLFSGFAVLFLREVVGDMNGTNALVYALQTNDSKYLMDALSLNNGSMVNMIFAGIFVGMFMNAIPTLVKRLFKDLSIQDKISQDAEKLRDNIAAVVKNVSKGIQGKIKAATEKSE
jgi:hypothetical protein